MKHQIRFYTTPSGKKIIQDWIHQQQRLNITKIGRSLDLLGEYGLNLLCTKWVKKINTKPGIFELRINGKNQIRLLFAEITANELMILNIFVKKTQKTPSKELNLAISRMLTIITK